MLGLFSQDSEINLLPYDGEVNYFGAILDKQHSDFYLKKLLDSIEWKNDEVIIFGKHITTKRKTAWYGDKDFAYTYSNITRKALLWTKELLQLKKLAEEKSGSQYNSCLLNLYHDGEEGMAWHSDDEKEMKEGSAIASLSFGAERKFSFKHKKTAQSLSLMLEHGSLLVMKGAIQTSWLHALPKTKKIANLRVNLTFRAFVETSSEG